MSNSDVPNQEPQRNDWNQEDLGKRHNNQGDKGLGFYGKIPLDSEKFDYATEYSFVPGLSSKEFTLLKDQASNNMDEEEIPDSIMEKIKKHAKNRLIKGKSPFWEEGEKQHSPPVDQASK